MCGWMGPRTRSDGVALHTRLVRVVGGERDDRTATTRDGSSVWTRHFVSAVERASGLACESRRAAAVDV